MKDSLEKQIRLLLCSDNEEQLMRVLYTNYSQSLYAVAYKILEDEDLASDALQEAFIKIWSKKHQYNPEKARVYTWMYRIVRNKAIDVQRSHNLRLNRKDAIDDPDYTYQLSSPCMNIEVLDLKHHLRSLDLKYQSVINALFIKGLTQEEAALKLDIPLGTVKSREAIAIRELRRIYIN